MYNQSQYDANYNNGYNAGQSASPAAGTYQISFRINCHDENVNQWVRYVDTITIQISSNGSISLGSPSFMNAQIRPEQGEYCNLNKI